MINYVLYHSPDERILSKAKKCLDEGGLVVMPTDTNWQIVCNPYKASAVEKLYRIKGENLQKHFSFLCDTVSRASEIAEIDNLSYRKIKKIIPGHYTFIFKAKKLIRKYIRASKTDHEVGIRFSPSRFIQTFLSYYGQILLSTNITNKMLDQEDDAEIYSILIEEALENRISMIIDPGVEYDFLSSSIVSFTEDIPHVIRDGSGDISIFNN